MSSITPWFVLALMLFASPSALAEGPPDSSRPSAAVVLDLPAGRTQSLSISADGSRWAITSSWLGGDEVLSVYDSADGSLLLRRQLTRRSPRSVTSLRLEDADAPEAPVDVGLGPDGTWVAVIYPRSIEVVSVVDGSVLHRAPLGAEESGRIEAVAFAPDGDRVA
ncbi:MAG: hypothetical protein KDA24_29525, partial [Deltaproteobacteria bacterium]|nr:hypothetical protein [Deltaproteobacteria bacterium]